MDCGHRAQHDDLLRGSPQLGAQFDFASEVAVPLIDLTQRVKDKFPKHDGGATGALDRNLLASRCGLKRRLQRHIGHAGRRQSPHLGHGSAGFIDQQRADGPHFGMRLKVIGQPAHRFAGDARIVVQTENVFALGYAQTDIQRLRETEVARQAAETYSGEFIFDLWGIVREPLSTTTIWCASPSASRLRRSAVGAIERDDHDRHAWRLRRGGFGWRSQSVILL